MASDPDFIILLNKFFDHLTGNWATLKDRVDKLETRLAETERQIGRFK